MAKNWTAAEAAKVIVEGTDIEAIADIGRRFPVISNKLARCNSAVVEVMATLPEYITIRKMEAAFKNSSDDDEEVEVETEAPKKKEKKAKKEEKPAKKAPKKEEKKKKPVVVDDDDDDDDFDLDDDDED